MGLPKHPACQKGKKLKEIDTVDLSGLWGAIVMEIPCRQGFTDTENFPEICYIPLQSICRHLKKYDST